MPKIVINKASVMLNGSVLPSIPRFDVRPPKREEVSSEKVAADATSKILAMIPRMTEMTQIDFPFELKVSKILKKIRI
jgi:hypothetical protein